MSFASGMAGSRDSSVMLLRLHLSLTPVFMFVSLLGCPSPRGVNLGSSSSFADPARDRLLSLNILAKGPRKVFISPLWVPFPSLSQALWPQAIQ